MENKIRLLHSMDNIAVFISVAAVWVTIIMILFRVIELSTSRIFTVVSAVSAVSVLVALTVTSAALIFHLKKNRKELYEDELLYITKKEKAAQI